MYGASVTARATADLASTNYTTFLDLRNTLDNKVTCEITATFHSMSSLVWTAYSSGSVSAADVPIWQNGQKMTGTLTGTTNAALVFECPGSRYFRMGFVPAGTTDATDDVIVTYRYNDYETTVAADGGLRID